MRYLNSIETEYLEGLSKPELISLIEEYKTHCSKVDDGRPVLSSADAVCNYFKTYDFEGYREHLFVLLLTAELKLHKTVLISSGAENRISELPISVIFKEILSEKFPGNKVIIVHNHPGGNPEPSSADIQFTAHLKKCGEMLEIRVLDHVIIAGEKASLIHYSMQASGDI